MQEISVQWFDRLTNQHSTRVAAPELCRRIILSGIDTHGLRILSMSKDQSVDTAVAMRQNGDHGIPVPNYVEEVSTKIVKLIQSYTGVVNKMVWRKF